MHYYQHKFERAEEYLHHRPPYLLVDQIALISPTEVVTSKIVTGDEFYIQGHFPGAPILPGAIMQELTTQSAGILIAAQYNPMKEFNTSDPYFNEYALGVLVKIQGARFRSFARPGDQLTARIVLNEHVGRIFEFSGSVSIGNRVIMRNSFQLTNVKSQVLQG